MGRTTRWPTSSRKRPWTKIFAGKPRESIELWVAERLGFDELRRKVTSPGGTTARALASFERSGLSDVVDRGMEACLQRAREMAEEFK